MSTIQQQIFGEVNGREVSLFTLINRQGMRLSISNYGCIITQLWAPDRQGNLADVVLGFDSLERYLAGHPFFGAIAGRCANRIADGRFTLDGQHYRLATNEAATGQHLHGGSRGFDKQVWQAEPDGDGVIFSYCSGDGEEGYPGNLRVRHRIGLNEENALTFDFWAETDRATPVNLVNHSYYNLAGHRGEISRQQLQIFADFMTPVDEQSMLPTGEILRVAGSAFDFTQPTLLADAMALRENRDFDVNYVLRVGDAPLRAAAVLSDPASGRMMEVYTTQPGVQFYNAFKLSNKVWIGKDNHQYSAFSGLCLETQAFPDSIHFPHFSNVVLRPGETYQTHTEHRFSARG